MPPKKAEADTLQQILDSFPKVRERLIHDLFILTAIRVVTNQCQLHVETFTRQRERVLERHKAHSGDCHAGSSGKEGTGCVMVFRLLRFSFLFPHD